MCRRHKSRHHSPRVSRRPAACDPALWRWEILKQDLSATNFRRGKEREEESRFLVWAVMPLA